MVFGVLRSCYYAPARFQVNGPASTIRWYFAPEGAAIYTAPNIFFPLSQTLQYKPTDGVGELYGGGYPYFNGVPFPSWAGDVAHGTEADFLGETVYAGPTPEGEVPLCAFDPADYMECPSCDEVLAPKKFFVTISTPDYPEIDGMVIEVDGDNETGDCEWHGSVVVGDTFVAVDVFSRADLDPHTLEVEVDWPASPYGEWHMDTIVTPEEFSCLPWGFDYTDDAFVNSLDSGNSVRVRTTASGIPVQKATFEIGAEAVSPVTRPGGVEIGGETTDAHVVVGALGGVEIGGETTGEGTVPGFEATLELGAESELVTPPSAPGVRFQIGINVP